MLHPFFFEHFADTCFVAEDDAGQPVGFLIGFLSQTRPAEAYIRLVAVPPDFRGTGTGRSLYEAFFAAARAAGRFVVRSVTSPENRTSVTFHTRLGFVIEPGDAATEDGLPITANYDGRGGARIRFVKRLDG